PCCVSLSGLSLFRHQLHGPWLRTWIGCRDPCGRPVTVPVGKTTRWTCRCATCHCSLVSPAGALDEQTPGFGAHGNEGPVRWPRRSLSDHSRGSGEDHRVSGLPPFRSAGAASEDRSESPRRSALCAGEPSPGMAMMAEAGDSPLCSERAVL